MPGSLMLYKVEVARHVRSVADLRKTCDVGCGSGIWADLLGHGLMDAVEVFSHYAPEFGLEKKYKALLLKDIRQLDFKEWHAWEYVIMGDVLEHLPISTAQAIVKRRTAWGKKLLVAVPYLAPQGPSHNNAHEAHIQDDLTPDVIRERYPELSLLIGNDVYGYWVNYPAAQLVPDEVAA